MAWYPIARLDELPVGEVVAAQAGDTPVALYNLDGTIFATHNICTHAHACLSDGYLDGDRIECPLHQALFDIRTGRVLSGPTDCDLAVYPVRVEGGRVLVEVMVPVTVS